MTKAMRVLQVNLNNKGGVFALMYQAQIKLYPEIIFDYFSPNKFVNDDRLNTVLSLDSHIEEDDISGSRFLKQIVLHDDFEKYLMENHYDIVHIHSDTSWKLAVYALAAQKAGVKNIICHSHSSGINGHYKALNRILHFAFRPVINRTATVRCACSHYAAQWMFGTENGIEYISNGVDAEGMRFCKKARSQIRNELGVKEDTVIITAVGDFSYQKNPQFILKLMKVLREDNRYRFLMVGGGEYKERFESEIRKTGLDDIVIFTGAVTNVADYLSASDIYIMPSRFEGLPISALEAEANGAYVIVSTKITPETEKSVLYQAVDLKVSMWVDTIRKIKFDYDRENRSSYLIADVVDIGNAAKQLKKLYEKLSIRE